MTRRKQKSRHDVLCSVKIECVGRRHGVALLANGQLALENHSRGEIQAEMLLTGMGGQPCQCVKLLGAWKRRHNTNYELWRYDADIRGFNKSLAWLRTHMAKDAVGWRAWRSLSRRREKKSGVRRPDDQFDVTEQLWQAFVNKLMTGLGKETIDHSKNGNRYCMGKVDAFHPDLSITFMPGHDLVHLRHRDFHMARAVRNMPAALPYALAGSCLMTLKLLRHETDCKRRDDAFNDQESTKYMSSRPDVQMHITAEKVGAEAVNKLVMENRHTRTFVAKRVAKLMTYVAASRDRHTAFEAGRTPRG